MMTTIITIKGILYPYLLLGLIHRADDWPELRIKSPYITALP